MHAAAVHKKGYKAEKLPPSERALGFTQCVCFQVVQWSMFVAFQACWNVTLTHLVGVGKFSKEIGSSND